MPTQNKSPMSALYQRLEEVGIKTQYVRKVVLPSWWDDDSARTKAGYAQGALLIARHIGLDAASLLSPESPVTFTPCTAPKFKKHLDADADKSRFAVYVARQAACLTAQAMTTPYTPIPGSTAEIRRQVLALSSKVPVILESLLEWCWHSGIPVIHLSKLPAHKPQALVARIEGRPVIVLCDNQKFDAWLAFLIAHELAHIAKGHLPDDDDFLLDTNSLTSENHEEKEANAGACEILTGDPEAAFVLPYAIKTTKLAAAARAYGQEHEIDPAAILLNIAYQQKQYLPLIMKTLKEISPTADAAARVRTAMHKHLNWDALPEDSVEFLLNVSGNQPAVSGKDA